MHPASCELRLAGGYDALEAWTNEEEWREVCCVCYLVPSTFTISHYSSNILRIGQGLETERHLDADR